MRKAIVILAIVTALPLFLPACSPTVKVEAPEKPITINMNIKIEHEIRVKVEKDIEDALSQESGLF